MSAKPPQDKKPAQREEPSSIIGGLSPIPEGDVAAFKEEMANNVIPEIVKVVEERRALASESRQRPLKC